MESGQLPHWKAQMSYTCLMANFGEWLDQELATKGWTRADLSRASGITEATLSRIVSGTRGVGPDVAKVIAETMHIDPVIVFRKAGILPPSTAELREQHPRLDYVYRLLADMYHKEPSHFDAVVFMVEAVANVKPSAPEPGPELLQDYVEPAPVVQPATETGEAHPVDHFAEDQFEALYDLHLAQFGEEEGLRRFRRLMERFEEKRRKGRGERKEGADQQAAKRERPDM